MKLPLPQVSTGKSLSDRVTASIRKAILEGHFAPGEKLDPEIISRELDVSGMPVREAFRRLEAERLIDYRSHRGAFVPTLTKKDIQEIYVLRKLLEVEVVRLVTLKIPDSLLSEIERRVNEEEERLKKGDSSQHSEVDSFFHNSLINYLDNQLLKEVLLSIGNRIQLVRLLTTLQSGPHMMSPTKEHQEILSAIRKRDPEEAARLMGIHLDTSSERVQSLPWV